VQDLLTNLQSAAWWLAAIIATLAGNVAWAILLRLFPYLARYAVPAARVLLIVFTVATWGALFYCAVNLPPGFRLSVIELPHVDDMAIPLAMVFVASAFTFLIVVFGPRVSQVAPASLILVLVAWLAYASIDLPPSISSETALWLTLWGYSFIEPSIIVVFTFIFFPAVMDALAGVSE